MLLVVFGRIHSQMASRLASRAASYLRIQVTHRGFASGELIKIAAFLFLLLDYVMTFVKMNAFEYGEDVDLFLEFGFLCLIYECGN